MQSLAALFVSWVITAMAGQSTESTDGWLHGRVEDAQGAVVPGIHVKVSSSKFQCETQSDSEGRFHCRVHAGTYDVTASGNQILPYERARIRIPEGHVHVNIRPVFVEPYAKNGILETRLAYYSRASLADPNLDVALRYERQSSVGNRIVFRGNHLMLSFDVVTVYAKEITCAKTMEECSGAGEVLVDLGTGQSRGLEFALDLLRRRVVLKRETEIDHRF